MGSINVALGGETNTQVTIGDDGAVTVVVTPEMGGDVVVEGGGSVPLLVSQALAEAGVATGIYSWSPERIAQAIAALAGSGTAGVLPVRTESEVAALLAANPDAIILSASVVEDPAETNPPTGESVTIDEGAAVSSLSVTLTLFATDDTGVTEMMLGNDAGFTGGAWEAYATSKAWALAAGGDGARSVFAKFRDASLNVSGVASDSTTYTAPANTAPSVPVVSLVSNGDGTTTISLDTASTDTEDGTITTYEVYVDAVKHGADVTGWTQGTSHQLTGLTNDTAPSITAKAKDSGGLLSNASNAVTGHPSAAWFSDDLTTVDPALWEYLNPAYYTEGSGKILLDTSADAAFVAELRCKQGLAKTKDARLSVTLPMADSCDIDTGNSWYTAPTVVQEQAAVGGYDVAKVIWWIQPYGDNGATRDSLRLRYYDNTGTAQHWDEAGAAWTTSSAAKGLNTVGSTDDVKVSIEIDDTNSRWRMVAENLTTPKTVTTDWVNFTATRDLAVGTYFLMPVLDTTVSYKMTGSITEAVYEAL